MSAGGVSATALCPGQVDTGFGEAAGFDQDDAEKALPSFMWVDAAQVARAGSEQPRVGVDCPVEKRDRAEKGDECRRERHGQPEVGPGAG